MAASVFYGMGRVALHTLGCKLNYAETSSVGERFSSAGFESVQLTDHPDVVFINSCTVTSNADRECRQIVRRALRSNPDACVIVTGCYAQLQPEEIASIEGVDFVLGAREKFRIDELIPRFEKQVVPVVHVGEFSGRSDFGPAHTGEGDGRTRAFLKVQDGCDYNCSFCTIPLARGESRSQPLDEAVESARHVVSAGYSEIVLTGVNTGDYGRKKGVGLIDLLRRLHSIDGLLRLRISSIEPNLLTDEILDLARDSSIMVPHFHIPLQSGSDAVLSDMRRRYRTAEYRRLIARIRERMPDCGIGIDVITGFPTESDICFEETVAFLQEIDPSYLHVFTYSERPDTPAAGFERQVDVARRRERTSRLRTLSELFKARFAARYQGEIRPTLIESARTDGEVFGYTDNYVRVRIDAESVLPIEGTIRPVRLGAWGGEFVEGILMEAQESSEIESVTIPS